MEPPFASIELYYGNVHTISLREGRFTIVRPHEEIPSREVRWRTEAYQTIRKYRALGAESAYERFLQSKEMAQELVAYVQELLPQSETHDSLSHCRHGHLWFHHNLRIPSYTFTESDELFEKLLEFPHFARQAASAESADTAKRRLREKFNDHTRFY